MDLWIPVTLTAAAAQTLRFVLQKKLSSTRLSTAGATFARFAYSAPIVALMAMLYLRSSGQSLPEIPAVFWAYVLTGGAAQIIATNAVVSLFKERNFAVGLTFKKTEVMMSVLVGILVLGEGVTARGFAAICLGLVGVFLLSDPPGGTGRCYQRIWNRAAGLGLLSGAFFAVSGVGYRAASLSLGSGDPFQRAVVTLACVTAVQVLAMVLWLSWREAGEILRVLKAWRMASVVGLASLVGSTCWFWAFTLQTVAYVNALGQVELIFALAASVFVFGEKVSAREWQGLAVLTASILGLVLVT
jgi:drug/metabolite transporter (DMT)-like permease